VHNVSNAGLIEPFGQNVKCCPDVWSNSVVHSECTLHQVAPFIGKLKSSIARSLIESFTKKGQTIYDPFSGSGTVTLESWINGRNAIANDLSPYAHLLTKVKLCPPARLEHALKDLSSAAIEANDILKNVDTVEVPDWVAKFFHRDTLREILAWTVTLKNSKNDFLLAALLGILHHQRPGFLSFPSSHTVPYLRKNLFPQHKFPHLYTYRSVQDRLEKKVRRIFKRIPLLDRSLTRRCYQEDAANFTPPISIDGIITSPPYMRQLDYGRDNRLRLWFLGTEDWKSLDKEVSPREESFLKTMTKALEQWKEILPRRKHCILVLGDTPSRRFHKPLPSVIAEIAINQVGGYEIASQTSSTIPRNRRVRRDYCGSSSEIVLVLKRI
jgi:adenine-specific DNA methylase